MRVNSAWYGMLAAVVLVGCSSDPQLNYFDSSQDGPEEFAVLPTKSLQMPPDLNQLPAPTPGGGNITDPTPLQDAVASLGGDPGRLTAGGIGAADGALVTYASRAGVDSGIRQIVAAEDEQYRKGRGRRFLEIIARTNVYYRAYEPQSIDPWGETERWRNAGARVPSAPPAPAGKR